MQTTLRFTVTVSRLTLAVLYSRCLSAFTRFRRGWRQTGCSWIQPRPSQLVRIVRQHHDLDWYFVSVILWYRQSLPPGIGVQSTSTPTSRWRSWCDQILFWHRAGQLFSSARPSPAIVKKGQPKRGGGLAFIYNIQLSVKPIKSSLVPKTFELQLVGVQVANIIVKVANIYRPPGLSKSAFLDEFADLLASLGSGTGERLIICGDLNIPSLDAVNIDERLTSLLDIHGYQQHVTQSTRHDPRQLPLRRDNLLDLVITSTLMHLQVRWFLTLRYSTHTVRLTPILTSAISRWCVTSCHLPATPTVT